MHRKNHAFSGSVAVILASVLWGTTGTVASFTPNVSPLATGAFAMGVCGVLLMITSAKKLVRDKALLLSLKKILILGGLSVAIYPLVFYSSMRLSGVAIGTLISIASAPFFSMLLERLISKKPIRLRWMISFIFGVLGILFLTLGKQGEVSTVSEECLHSLGIMLGFVAGLTYATYSWVARRMIETGVSSNSAMASMFGIAALILLPSLFITGENLFSGAVNTGVALYMALVPMFLGYLCFGYGLRHTEASSATLITLLEPVIATLFAIVIVGERFFAIGWIGMLFIGLCLAIQVVKRPQIRGRVVSSQY